MADILPGPPVAKGKWDKIVWPGWLIKMHDGKVLVWNTEYGFWRLFAYDPLNTKDVLPDPVLNSGKDLPTLPTNRLIKMIDGRVLHWNGDGTWNLWNYDPKTPGVIFPTLHASGQFDQIKDMGSPKWHELIAMPDGKVLDWVYMLGSWRLWNYVPQSKQNVLPTMAAAGEWKDKLSYDVVNKPRHELLAMSGDRVLDWVPTDGSYRVWDYDPQNTSDVFPGAPAEQGQWAKAKWGATASPDQMVVMQDGRVLAWARATGEWSLWDNALDLPSGGPGPESAPLKLTLDRWFADVDPMSRLLMKVFILIKKPRPPVSRVRQEFAPILRGLSAGERRDLSGHIKALKGYLDALEGMLGKR